LIYWKSKHSKPNFNKLINKSKELIYGWEGAKMAIDEIDSYFIDQRL
jgi:hypothetical protein